MEERKVEFSCPDCGYEMSMEVQVQEVELPEHVFDHIMECKDHYERAVDFIFNKFTEMGVAVKPSGIRQILKYFDEFCYFTASEFYDEEGNYVGDESVQSEDTDDNQSEE